MGETIREPQTKGHLEFARKLQRGEAPPPPIATLIGFRPVEVELGRALMEMQAEPRHANPMGTLHGGVICDFADAAMGIALSTTLEDDETFTTLDLTAKYFKPIWSARLRALARVTRRTRSLGFIECDVSDEGGSLVAKVYSSCMILRGDDARGR
jgi:uncharacterized protein (TIGR00369 family)